MYAPIGLVERNIRKVQDYVKIFFAEENKWNMGVKRVTRVMRFSVSSSAGKAANWVAPWQKHKKNLTDIEYQKKNLTEKVHKSTGETQNEWSLGSDNPKKLKSLKNRKIDK